MAACDVRAGFLGGIKGSDTRMMQAGLTDVEMGHFHMNMTDLGGDGGWRLASRLTSGVHQVAICHERCI